MNKLLNLIPALLALTPTLGCPGGAKKSGEDPWYSTKVEAPAPSINLFDAITSATITGTAAGMLERGHQIQKVDLLAADFEDGSMPGLSLFTGYGTAAPSPGLVSLVEGDAAFEGGKSVLLQAAGAPHGVSLRTGPIPVSAAHSYALSYHVMGEGVRTAQNMSYGGASVILYRIPGADAEQAAEVLKDPARELAARLDKGKNPASFWIPGHYGDSPWSLDQDHFFVPPEATHMVVSFDLNRPNDDRAELKAYGRVVFDDILLQEIHEPLHARYHDIDDGFGPAHPLKVRVQHPHPGHKKSTEARYAIAAPAGTDLSYTLTVPPGGVIGFGYALTPDALGAGGGDVTFAVEVGAGGAKGQELFAKALDDGDADGWRDAEVDLSAFEGQEVTLSLKTRGSGDDAGLKLPGAAAVWGYPVVHSRTRPGRTLVLVAFDTLQANHLSTYGYPVVNSPQLSRIAAESVTFDRAVSPSPWTLAGFAAMLTGYDPAHHRAGERQYGTQAWRRPLADDFVTLSERLRAQGWETRAWINNPYLTAEFGLDQGFSTFIDVGTRSDMEASAPAMESILEYLAKPVGYDRFLFIHFMDPHGPYRPNDTFRDRFLTDKAYEGKFKDIIGGWEYLDLTQGKLKANDADKKRIGEFYDAVISYSDGLLGQVFDAARRVSAPDRFAFVVTADHGEELWEHDLYEHGHQMYDELLHVPLVVYVPDQVEAGRRVSEAVSSHDVAPTLLTLAGIKVPEAVDSSALQPYLKQSSPPADRLLFGHQMLYGVQRNSVEQGGMKLIYNQSNTGNPEARSPRPKERYELYDLRKDPGEKTSVYRQKVEEARALMQPLATSFVRSLAGKYVVYLAGDAEAHKLEGTLTMPSNGQFLRYTEDMLWPLANGLRGTLNFRPPRAASPSVMGFDLHAPRGLVAFTVDKGSSDVIFDLKLDGQPVPLESLVIGAGATQAQSWPVTLTDSQLALPPSALLRAGEGGGLKVVIAKLNETPELIGVQERAISDDTAAELRALGYTE